ncbi:ATP-binding protein [Nocardioides sp. ChNu-153]|uniref:ATP-binding protein n=1 Tax=unclassified Nocardioides TaxID=2615069 RepID=UPI0024060F75|nr:MULTISPECIES: ATP-binding protein [unclassified Nocardioides]MDF9714618.1 ATP-binding protein [Nocardioides sp. ChNu-99]MDN7119848.1 ATP-binding protein [Nocardioides sp. ChNu-153]
MTSDSPVQLAAWRSVDLPHDDEAVRATRVLLRDALGPDGADLPSSTVTDTVIVAGELVLNAVDHGMPGTTGTIEFSWRLTRQHVVLRVVDAGVGPDIVRGIGSDDSLRGRGLVLVEALSDSWSADRTGRTTVTARIPRERGVPGPR